MGVHPDAAFGTAVRNISDGVLNGHPRSQRLHFVFIRLGMETNAPFGRAPGCGMLYPVAGENLHMAVIHADRNAHGQFPFRVPYKFIILFLVTQYLSCFVQHIKHVFIRIVIRHSMPPRMK